MPIGSGSKANRVLLVTRNRPRRTAAYDDLYYAIEDLYGDNSAGQNLEDLEDELSAIPSAYRATFDGSGC